MYKRHLLTNQKKTIASICLGKKEIVKCEVEKYTFFYIIALVYSSLYIKRNKLNLLPQAESIGSTFSCEPSRAMTI